MILKIKSEKGVIELKAEQFFSIEINGYDFEPLASVFVSRANVADAEGYGVNFSTAKRGLAEFVPFINN